MASQRTDMDPDGSASPRVDRGGSPTSAAAPSHANAPVAPHTSAPGAARTGAAAPSHVNAPNPARAIAPGTARTSIPGVAPARGSARTRILRLLHDSDTPITKQQMARDLGLSMPTVYQALGSLVADGIACDRGELSSTGGRRASTFGVNPQGRVAAGAYLTAHHLATVLCDLDGTAIASTRERIDAAPTGASPLVNARVFDLLEKADVPRKDLLGVCLALPGTIDPTTGNLAHAPTLGVSNVPASSLTTGIEAPALIANDACCGGFAEWYGQSSPRDLAYVSLEDGVGGAILANGVNLAGTHGRSAEFGHLCVEPDGRPCSCGKRGCLETYCSAQVLSNAGSGSVDGFFSRLETGDEQARQIWESYAAHLARAIHDICMVLDGDIVLGGAVASHLEAHLDDLRERVGALDPFDPGASYLKVSRHPLDAVPLGAALTLVARFFGDA